VQEIWWKLTEIMSLKEYILINSGSIKNDYGTCFMVRKHCEPNIVGYKLINERICVLTMQGRFVTRPMYVSTHLWKKKVQRKKINFMRIWNIYNKTPTKDVQIILGDFNAKIGKEHLFKPITALYNKQEESSESGNRATDFAEAKNVHISSTFLPHKTIHKETWISPDGETKIVLIL
jgi:hypothetical protein